MGQHLKTEPIRIYQTKQSREKHKLHYFHSLLQINAALILAQS